MVTEAALEFQSAAFPALRRVPCSTEMRPLALMTEFASETTPVPDADALPSRPTGLAAQPRALADTRSPRCSRFSTDQTKL